MTTLNKLKQVWITSHQKPVARHEGPYGEVVVVAEHREGTDLEHEFTTYEVQRYFTINGNWTVSIEYRGKQYPALDSGNKQTHEIGLMLDAYAKAVEAVS